jgi:hypothetical protein
MTNAFAARNLLLYSGQKHLPFLAFQPDHQFNRTSWKREAFIMAHNTRTISGKRPTMVENL